MRSPYCTGALTSAGKGAVFFFATARALADRGAVFGDLNLDLDGQVEDLSLRLAAASRARKALPAAAASRGREIDDVVGLLAFSQGRPLVAGLGTGLLLSTFFARAFGRRRPAGVVPVGGGRLRTVVAVLAQLGAERGDLLTLCGDRGGLFLDLGGELLDFLPEHQDHIRRPLGLVAAHRHEPERAWAEGRDPYPTTYHDYEIRANAN